MVSVNPYMWGWSGPDDSFNETSFRLDLDTVPAVRWTAGYPGMELGATGCDWPRCDGRDDSGATLPPGIRARSFAPADGPRGGRPASRGRPNARTEKTLNLTRTRPVPSFPSHSAFQFLVSVRDGLCGSNPPRP
jgi:hypothetical protein